MRESKKKILDSGHSDLSLLIIDYIFLLLVVLIQKAFDIFCPIDQVR